MIHINTFCSEYWNNSTRGLFKFRILRFIWIYPEPKISLQRAACASSAAGWPHLVSRNMPSYWFVAVIQAANGYFCWSDFILILIRWSFTSIVTPGGKDCNRLVSYFSNCCSLHIIIIIIIIIITVWPPRWSSGQHVWLLIMRSRVRSPARTQILNLD